jgi:hypothetical protein
MEIRFSIYFLQQAFASGAAERNPSEEVPCEHGFGIH